jgi:hypothetical protein
MTISFVHVHGRGPKPDGASLEALWRAALRAGIERCEPDHLPAFDAAIHQFVFYGDLLNDVLGPVEQDYDAMLDLADRRHALERLRAMKRKAFGSRAAYERLPGRNSIGEFLADTALPVISRFSMSDGIFSRVVPDLHRYLVDRDGLGRAVRARLQSALEDAFARGGDVVLVAHCLGSVAAFDVLWSLSQLEAPATGRQRVRLFLTLGSPLGDETVKSRLLGSAHKGRARYPLNLVEWVNISAEDDWISHDNSIANDYDEMLKLKLLSRIDDHKIHNFAVRFGKSNPHSAIGYLIHPRVARTLASVLPAVPSKQRENEKED